MFSVWTQCNNGTILLLFLCFTILTTGIIHEWTEGGSNWTVRIITLGDAGRPWWLTGWSGTIAESSYK